MVDFTTEGVSTFCDAAAILLSDFRNDIRTRLSDASREIFNRLEEAEPDFKDEHPALALILRDAKAFRLFVIQRMSEDSFDGPDIHALAAHAAETTARGVEALLSHSPGNVVTFPTRH